MSADRFFLTSAAKIEPKAFDLMQRQSIADAHF